MSARVFVLGIDGAPLAMTRRWAEEGHLPVFQRLLSEGAYGNLESVFPPLTAPAWTSFLTGRNPGKHGVGDWYVRNPGKYRLRPVDATSIKCSTIWDETREGGKKIVSLGLPMNYPLPRVNGIIVAGLESPGGGCSAFPESVEAEIMRVAPDFRTRLREAYRPGRSEPVIEDLLSLVDVQSKLAQHFLSTAEWDLFVLQQQASDWAMHFFWHCMDPEHPRYTVEEGRRYGDAILRIFQRIDDGLGKIMDALPPDADLLIVSDHGFGPLDKFVYLNIWLMKLGLLKLKRDPLTRAKRLLFDLGVTPSALYRLAERTGANKFAFRAGKESRYKILSRFFLSQDSIDWPRTRAYSVGNIGQIYVNLKGREPEGVVEPGDEYEAIRDRIISAALKWTDPDNGESVISRAERKDDVYTGPYVDELPDVLLFPREFRYQGAGLSEFMSNRLMGHAFAFTGGHRMEGLLLAWGPHIKPGPIEGASIMDMTPTILHLLGLPVPSDMDGRVLLDCLDEAVHQAVNRKEAASAASVQGDGYSPDEEREVAQRLRALGYFD
jgi:predicted AlkP superfamily phosphohydrolase/phosphomutase